MSDVIVIKVDQDGEQACPYCGMYECTMEHSGEVALANQAAVHPGVPMAMAGWGLVAIIVLTHLLIGRTHGAGSKAAYWRFPLLRGGWLNRVVRSRCFPLAVQSLSMVLFLLIIVAGLIGTQRASFNIAPWLTWTWWWALLIFFIVGFGKAFCVICPWEGISALVSSLSLSSRKKRIGHEWPWPKVLRNIYPALFLFVLLTWFELGMDITHSPSMTSILAILFVAIAVLTAIFFEKRAFCRYVCLVGRVQGLYAMFSPVELRPKSMDPCRTCVGKECYNGSDTATGCPMELFPAALNQNTYCTLCTECIRACPHDNLEINVRPPATDLLRKKQFRWDEAIFAIALLALTSFHGLTMTPAWRLAINAVRVETGLGPKSAFTALMFLAIAIPFVMFWIGASTARALNRSSNVSVGLLFKAFAYSVIPVALFYHLAHNSMHFFMEAQDIVPVLSDPFGWGWDLFGTAGQKHYPALLSMNSIWWIQIVMIVIGHVYGVIVADRIARKVFSEDYVAWRNLAPLLVTMIMYSAFSVWLIAQPMEMRSGM